MRKVLRALLLASLTGVFVFMIMGCEALPGKYTGGGYIDSAKKDEPTLPPGLPGNGEVNGVAMPAEDGALPVIKPPKDEKPPKAEKVAKANFGFNVHAIDENGDGQMDINDSVKGQFQYNDHGVGIKVHGEVLKGYINGSGEGVLAGTYRSQPGNGSGFFRVKVKDNGEPGVADPADWIFIALYGTQTDAENEENALYLNFGKLKGGNIQYHPPKDNGGNGDDDDDDEQD